MGRLWDVATFAVVVSVAACSSCLARGWEKKALAIRLFALYICGGSNSGH